jgi:hypothetical protein
MERKAIIKEFLNSNILRSGTSLNRSAEKVADPYPAYV